MIDGNTHVSFDYWSSDYWRWRDTWDAVDNAIVSRLDGDDRIAFEKKIAAIAADETDSIRNDAIRLSTLERDGGRVVFKGKRLVPNRPYRKGDKLAVLAVKNGYVKLVEFGAEDVDAENFQEDPHKPQYWANAFMLGQPERERTGSDNLEKLSTVVPESKADEAIVTSGVVLSEDEFDDLAAIDILATLERIVENSD